MGFNPELVNQEITVRSDNINIGFTSKNFTVEKHSNDVGYYNLDGSYLGKTVYGCILKSTAIPKGIYNLEITLGAASQKIKITY